MSVCRLIYALGHRYRVCVKNLPGKPDLVFIGKKKAIFIHGGSGISIVVDAETECRKVELTTGCRNWRNKARDQANRGAMKAMGWAILIIWECETHDQKNADPARLLKFLG